MLALCPRHSCLAASASTASPRRYVHAHTHTYTVSCMHSVLPPCMCTHDRAHVCQVHGSFVMELYVVALTAAANLVLVHYNSLGYI